MLSVDAEIRRSHRAEGLSIRAIARVRGVSRNTVRKASDLIRVGEALRGLPAVANHVAIITHQDQKGRWIGIQGAPGGVGLVDCTPWLSDSRTRSNHEQPKPDDHNQLTVLLGSCAKSLGIQYDWVGIAGPGVVGHGTGAAGGVAAGDVGDIVAGFDVRFNGHGGPPAGYGARWSRHGHRVMHRYKRFGLRARTHG